MASLWPPERDDELQLAAHNVATRISADPSAFGVEISLAAELSAAAAAFSIALPIAQNISTRTRVAVAEKNTVRKALLAILRTVGGRVRTFPAITREQLCALGMPIPHRIKTPIMTPAARAAVHIIRSDRLGLEIRVSNLHASVERSAALPKGSVGYAVFTAVCDRARGEKPPADERDWRFIGIGTRPRFRIPYRADDAARQATIFVRYLNRKGQLGPASEPASCMVVAA